MLPPRSFRCFLAAAALGLCACHPGGSAERTPSAAPAPEAVDAGAPVLAAVQNARAAIAAGDPVAAFNDVNLGLGYAVQLVGAESALYPSEAAPPGYPDRGAGGGQQGSGGAGAGRRHRGGARPAAQAQAIPAAAPTAAAASALPATAPRGRHGGQGGQGTVTSFDVQVKLISAQAKLQARDVAGADADLRALEAGARAQAAPASLPLIRADQSLTLAAAAVSRGRLAQLRTQLIAAQGALEAYQGAPHAAEAKALAAAIGETMRRPGGVGALAPTQVALWAGVVGAWT